MTSDLPSASQAASILWPAEARRIAQAMATSDPNEQAREFAGEVIRHAT